MKRNREKWELGVLFFTGWIKRFVIWGILGTVALYGLFWACYWHDLSQIQKDLGDFCSTCRRDVQKRWSEPLEAEQDKGFAKYMIGCISTYSDLHDIGTYWRGAVHYPSSVYGSIQTASGQIIAETDCVAYLAIKMKNGKPLQTGDPDAPNTEYAFFTCPYEELAELKDTKLGESGSVWIRGSEFRPASYQGEKEGFTQIFQEGAIRFVFVRPHIVNPGQPEEKVKAEAYQAFKQVGSELYGIRQVPDFLNPPFLFGKIKLVYQGVIEDVAARKYTVRFYWDFDSFWEVNGVHVRRAAWSMVALVSFLAVWGAAGVTGKRKRQLDTQHYTRTLMNSMAHDLKTPLTVIGGFAENLKEGTHPEKQEYYLEEIQNNTRYMSAIISENLELFQMENDGIAEQKVPLDLVELCQKQFEVHGSVLEERKLSVTYGGTYKIKGNEKWMERAMDNLVTNCLKYTSEGGRVEVMGKTHTFTIINTTDMVYSGRLKRLWQPFVMGEESRTGRKGTGLGLSIVHTVLERHGIRHYLRYDKKKHTFRVVFWRV